MSLTQVFSRSTGVHRAKSKTISEYNIPPPIKLNSKAQFDAVLSQLEWAPDRKGSNFSDATTRLQSVSWSDATTELASTLPPEKDGHHLELGTRASSVLLRDDYLKTKVSTSEGSQQLRHKNSSSSLHSVISHYERKNLPLVISQQTSASSIRDSALRKGAPVVVRPTSRDAETPRPMAFSKDSRPSSNAGGQKLSKLKTTSREPMTVEQASKSAGATLPSHVHEHKSDPRRTRSYTTSGTRSYTLADPSTVKVNVKRPKAGTKYWFDNLDDISDAETETEEPGRSDSFAEALQTSTPLSSLHEVSVEALVTKEAETHITAQSISVERAATAKIAKRDQQTSVIPPRRSSVAALNPTSPAEEAGRVQAGSRAQGRPSANKSNPLVLADLNNESVLHLSSDDDDDWQPPSRVLPSRAGVKIRDSIATINTSESEAEVGTARSIAAKRAIPRSIANAEQAGFSIGLTRRAADLAARRRSSKLHSFIDDSSSLHRPSSDMLTSFPATPQDSVSNRSSIRESQCFSDSTSVYSTQMVSLTRQEQSLIAAMRLKKASMKQTHKLTGLAQTPASTAFGYSTTSFDLYSDASASPSDYDAEDVTDEIQRIAGGLGINYQKRNSLAADDLLRRASCTTFDTGTSAPPSTFTYGSRVPTANAGPSTGRQRHFRDSATSAAEASVYGLEYTTSTHHHSRTATEGTHIVSLDDLDKGASRDTIQSEDFINWPYRGWVQARLGE